MTQSQDQRNDDHLAATILVMYLASAYRISTFSVYQNFFTLNSEILNKIAPFDEQMKKYSLKHFTDISGEMEIVYRVAIFDSFLNSISRLALVKCPEKALGDAQIHAGKLLSKSRSEIINEFIKKKAKSVSYASFGERLEWLKNTTGIDFHIPKEAKEKIKSISNFRNKIVHEWGYFNLSLSEDMSIISKVENNYPPIPNDIDLEVFDDVVLAIYEPFVLDFLKRKLLQVEVFAVEGLRRKVELPVNDSDSKRS